MSGFIEKITLYDLLGYAVPGSICLGMSGFAYMARHGNMSSLYETYQGAVGYFLTVLLVLGYVAGMLISEITDVIFGFFQESFIYGLKKDLMDKKINASQVEQVLKKAGYMKKEEKIQNTDDVLKYISSMYGDIQADAKYSRLHNYASSKLICKNMAFVSFYGIWIVYILAKPYLSGKMFLADLDTLLAALLGMVGFFVAGCLFKRRWGKMYSKTQFYTIIWFMEKYTGNAEKG